MASRFARNMTETDFSDAAVRNALMETLKGVDPDRYRAALMASVPACDRLLTLYAFHYGLDAAKDYCAATSGKLMQIAVQVAAPDLELTEARADGVAKAGLAWGLTGLARAYRHYQTRMLSELAFDDIRDAARVAYNEAGRALGKVDTALMPAIAYASLTPKYLSRMSGKFDPSKDSVTYGPAAKQLRLMRAGLTGRI